MGSASLEMIVIFLLILTNGFFAMSEFALISARKVKLAHRAAEGNRAARRALELAEAPGRLLSTVQIGITLVGVLAGAFGGATLAERISADLAGVPYLSAYREAIGLAIVVVVISYLTLVFGELIPKRIGLSHADRIAVLVGSPMRFVARAASPLVRLLTASTDSVLTLLGLSGAKEPPVTEEEVKMMIEHGTRTGVFEPAEKEIVERVFRLGDQRVGALMTPRTDIIWLDLNDPTDEIIRVIATSGHSRFPVAQGNLDNIAGIVRAKDILPRSLQGQPFDVRAVMREALFLPSSTRALKMLELFKTTATHIALVVDEHGGVEGLVTDHDVLEAVVGDIAQIDHPADKAVVRREDGSYLIDGMLGIDEFNGIFSIPSLTLEERGDFHTVGGFVMQQMGRIPVSGDHFEAAGLRFEVMDMDGRRVDKILVQRKPRKHR